MKDIHLYPVSEWRIHHRISFDALGVDGQQHTYVVAYYRTADSYDKAWSVNVNPVRDFFRTRDSKDAPCDDFDRTVMAALQTRFQSVTRSSQPICSQVDVESVQTPVRSHHYTLRDVKLNLVWTSDPYVAMINSTDNIATKTIQLNLYSKDCDVPIASSYIQLTQAGCDYTTFYSTVKSWLRPFELKPDFTSI